MERRAFEVVRRVLSADVAHYDTGGRQGAVDALITYPDGRRAALEVTLLTDAAATELEHLLGKDNYLWPMSGCQWFWTASRPRR